MLVSKTKKYKESVSLDLYSRYVSSGEGLNELVDSVIPLINNYIRSLNSSAVSRDTDEFAMSALEKCYALLAQKTPPDRKKSFTYFLISSINYDILNTRPMLAPEEFNLIESAAYLPYGRVLSQEDAELVIHCNQLTQEAYDRTVDAFRFSGSERYVCLKLLKDLCDGKEASTNFLSLRFGVPKPQVEGLKDYVKTVYRASCHDVYRSDLP